MTFSHSVVVTILTGVIAIMLVGASFSFSVSTVSLTSAERLIVIDSVGISEFKSTGVISVPTGTELA